MSNLSPEKRAKRKPRKGSWEVEMICKVRKSIIVDDCTEDEARNDPWGRATFECEIDQIDWEVVKVTPNE